MTQITLDATIRKSPDQISTDLGGEAVILGLQSEAYFSLEGVGLRLWEWLDEPKTAAELLAAILNAYEVEPARAERDLLAVLQEMADEGLIEIKTA